MTEITNAHRAERARLLIKKYMEDNEVGSIFLDTAAQDLVTDILHAVHVNAGWDSQRLAVFLRMASEDFDAAQPISITR